MVKYVEDSLRTFKVPAGAEPDADDDLLRVPFKQVKQPAKIKGQIYHPEYRNIMRDLSCGEVPYLFGRRGTGKSHIAKQVAEQLKLPLYEIGMVADVFSLIGYKAANGDYQPTDLYTCWTEGGVFLLDEMDRYPAEVTVVLNGGLENGFIPFPNGRKERHPDCYILGGGNTKGDGHSNLYVTAQAQDGAFMDRFQFHAIDLDEKMERKLGLAINPTCAAWVDWVQAARKVGDTIMVDVSPRVTYKGAKLLAAGASLKQVKKQTLFNKISVDAAKTLSHVTV